ncbi:MAG: cell wall hydrolase [Rhizobiaceae bacterium]
MPVVETRQIGASLSFAVILVVALIGNASPVLSDNRVDPTGGSSIQHRFWLARNYASRAGQDNGEKAYYISSTLASGSNWSQQQTRFIRLAPGDHTWAAKPLPSHSRSKSERNCLAYGVYFEARGESSEGQKAVAQVILNRVKNPVYPNTICGVVYQNRHKRNACQFSFACDGVPDRVKSRKYWKVSTKVANDAIDGRYWLMKVGSASHYHADSVSPKWSRKMRKMTKIGRHIFYRTFGGGKS